MGACKPLLPLGGGTVLERVLELFRRAGVAETLVVLGHRAETLRPVVLTGGGRPVLNERFQEGMFSSLQAGVAALPAGCRFFFVLPADMPLVRISTLAALAQALNEGDYLAAIPTHAGRRGHPPLIAQEMASRIMTWREPGGLRALWARQRERLREVPVDDPGILQDMDRPEQYWAMQRACLGMADDD